MLRSRIKGLQCGKNITFKAYPFFLKKKKKKPNRSYFMNSPGTYIYTGCCNHNQLLMAVCGLLGKIFIQ